MSYLKAKDLTRQNKRKKLKNRSQLLLEIILAFFFGQLNEIQFLEDFCG